MKKLLTEKKKKSIIVYLILWLLIAIVFVVPTAVALVDSTNKITGGLDTDSFYSIIGNYMLDLGVRIKGFETGYINKTKQLFGYYTILYAGIMIILILKSKNDGAYHNIEHGSSDWSQDGEEYKVLSRNSGILLAEKHYLPLNKPGNINVLIVGRIRFW